MAKLCLLIIGLLAVNLGLAPVAAADPKPFITAADLDIKRFLPPPPPLGSPQMQAELGELLTLQVTRTPEMVARASADVEEVVWRFADVMGPKFTPEAMPTVAAFFARMLDTEDAVVDPAKKVWVRPRPHLYSDLIKPAVKLSTSGSYPSGHSSVGTLMAIVLSEMVPEKRAALMARAWDYGHNRMVGGLHYASDVEFGRIVGNLIAEKIMDRPDFKAEFDAANAELHRVLAQ